MGWQNKLLLCFLFLTGCQRPGNSIELKPGQSTIITQYGVYDVVGCKWLQSLNVQPGAQAVVKVDIKQPPRPLTSVPAPHTTQSTINGVAEYHEGWQVEINDSQKRVIYRGGALTRTFDFNNDGVVTISDSEKAAE